MDNETLPFFQSELTTILVVADIAASKKFYVDVLGASVYREYGGDSMVLKFLNNWLLLVLPGEPTNDKPGVHFVIPSNKNHISHSFTIRVNNCRTTYTLLKIRGCEFITPPVTSGNETRCFFYDPDGHLFEISEYRQ